LGISVGSRWSHAAFVEKLGLSYRLLSDFDRKVNQAYGVLRNEDFAERALFLLDKEGVIRYTKVFDLGSLPDTTALQKGLADL